MTIYIDRLEELLVKQLRNRFEQANKPSLNKPSLNNIYNKPSIKHGLSLPKSEFARVATQLTKWGVTNSGAVIARENPQLVKQAVDYTIAMMDKVQVPKAYFRHTLKRLQQEAS